MAGQRVSDWRTAHGLARAGGALVVLENGRDRPLPSVSPAEPGRPDRDASGRFVPGNTWARRAKVRAGPTGVLAALDAKADPSWRAARRAGRREAQHRIRELAQFFGGDLSSTVCRLVRSACEQGADAAYLRARAAAEDAPELIRIAAQSDAASRQADRDAWEFASREAQARPQQNQTQRALDRILKGGE